MDLSPSQVVSTHPRAIQQEYDKICDNFSLHLTKNKSDENNQNMKMTETLSLVNFLWLQFLEAKPFFAKLGGQSYSK